MNYILHKESGTFCDYQTKDIKKYLPQADQGQLIYDIKTGNTYIII